MEDQLITFETAKLAKKKGFNEACLECFIPKGTLYNNNRENIKLTNKQLLISNCSAPTQSLLQKWLREEHRIFIWVQPWVGANYGICSNDFYCQIYLRNSLQGDTKLKNTYEEALEKGLIEALKLIK